MTINEMNCERFDEALSDYLEESLNGNDRAAVERHLKECVRCAGLVKDLDRIRTEAAALPDLVPSRDLWSGIEARIAAPVIPFAPREQKTTRFSPWMAAAAAALIVSTAGITYVLTSSSIRSSEAQRLASATNAQQTSVPQTATSGTPESTTAAGEAAPNVGSEATGGITSNVAQRTVGGRSPSGTQQTSSARLVSQQSDLLGSASDQVYGKEIAMLQRIVSDRKTQLDSATVAIIERNLRIIDAAISQSKAALVKDPASQLLSEQLTRALDKKVELLRTAAMLPAST